MRLRKLVPAQKPDGSCTGLCVDTDPRFDSTAGTFKEEHFRKAYGFVDDLRVRVWDTGPAAECLPRL